MKRIVLSIVLICSKIVFAPFEGAAYMGLHFGKDSETSRATTEQQKKESQSMIDYFKKRFNAARDYVKNNFSKISNTSSTNTRKADDFQHDKLSIYDDPYEADQAAEEQKIEREQYLERQQEIQQEIRRNRELSDSESVLNNPEMLSNLTSEEINQLNITTVSVKVFAALSAESITALLNKPALLNKLSDNQVRALNPERLSQALQAKLSTSLSLEFVQKLSWQQIRQILGDHTGIRLKNWFTEIEKKFTPDALSYMKTKTFDPDAEKKFKNSLQEDEYLTVQLQKLPKGRRPANIDTAIQYMQDGEKLWNELKDNTILNQIFFGMESSVSLTKEQQNRLKNIFNGTEKPDKNDPIFQEFMKSYQAVIIKLQWYFYKLSILEDGRAFEGGTITFNDPDKYLFNFLDTYAQLLNPSYKKSAIFNFSSPQGYRRTSSHFSGQTNKIIDGKKNTQNIGIDIDVPKGELGLPLNYPHLLFDQRDNGYVFMKCEPYGIGNLKDTALHTWSFIKTRGENDESKHSKDRIPKDVMNEFLKLYQGKLSITKKVINALGISGLFPLLTKDARAQFKQYVTQDRAKNSKLRNYQESSLQFRRGGESIINPA